MCVQDIKIGRNTEVQSSGPVTGGTLSVPTKVFDADASRIAVTMAFEAATNATSTRPMILYGRVASGMFPIAGISTFKPIDRVRIEDVGVAIQGELLLQDVGGAGLDVIVGTVRLLVDAGSQELR